mmetsp:Transcript_20203/g.63280  ORF Transcript_20203/g.63280 Transcript_20203/m.63280 type:complete len:134 (+) Transcript_20203:318-719(+)
MSARNVRRLVLHLALQRVQRHQKRQRVLEGFWTDSGQGQFERAALRHVLTKHRSQMSCDSLVQASVDWGRVPRRRSDFPPSLGQMRLRLLLQRAAWVVLLARPLGSWAVPPSAAQVLPSPAEAQSLHATTSPA